MLQYSRFLEVDKTSILLAFGCKGLQGITLILVIFGLLAHFEITNVSTPSSFVDGFNIPISNCRTIFLKIVSSWTNGIGNGGLWYLQ